MKRHHLPTDPEATPEATAWFHRYSPFVRAETERQVGWKRRTFPSWPDGTWHKRPTFTYPHLLPADRWSSNLFDGIRDEVLQYVATEDIAWHGEKANLRSSQVCCLNVLFPSRLDLDLAAILLAPALPGVRSVERIEFEWTGPEDATQWLGEPPGGKRGQNRTSADAAIWWDDGHSRRLTLLEWKYTETAFGTCSGYERQRKHQLHPCLSVDPATASPEDCYLQTGVHPNISRNYFTILQSPGGPLSSLSNGSRGCPFQGPLYQLLRNELLAEWHRRDDPDLRVDMTAVAFAGNDALRRSPRHLGTNGSVEEHWASRLGPRSGFREVTVEALLAAFDAAPSPRWASWRRYLRDRYDR